MKKANPKRRGRPRAFDEADVLDAMSDRFWTRGLEGTSLDDLAEAAGVNRPSLYGAFGDKLAMYVRSLEFFAGRMRDGAGIALAGEGNLKSALVAFYRSALDTYFGPPGPARGCLILSTAVADAHTHPEVRTVLEQVLAEIDAVLAARILAAGVSRAKAEELAKLATGGLIALATRARAGTPRAELDKLAAANAALLAGGVSGEE